MHRDINLDRDTKLRHTLCRNHKSRCIKNSYASIKICLDFIIISPSKIKWIHICTRLRAIVCNRSKKRNRRSVSEKTAVFCPTERRLWRLFICWKRSKYNYVNIQHFPKYVHIYNDAISHPILIKFCNLIRMFTGFSKSAADEFAADIQQLWPIARCSLAGNSGVGLASIPVDFIRRCFDYWHCNLYSRTFLLTS